MRPSIRYTIVLVSVLLFVCVGAAPALADEAVLVSRRVETVTGVELARELVSEITAVRFDSTGVVITLERDGVVRSIDLDVTGGDSGAESPLAGLAGLAATAMLFMRTAGRASRFFRT